MIFNRNFVLLWIAYGISAFGDHVSEMALLKMQQALADDVTDVTRRQAVMLFAFMFPFFALGPLWGWVADRTSRKWIMIAADLVRMVILFEMFAILTGLHRWADPQGVAAGVGLPLHIAIVPMVLVGVFAAMFSPARYALLPTLIREDQLIRANALTSGLGMIATILSAVIGGWLVQQYSERANFRLNALTFSLSALSILWIRQPRMSIRHTAEHGLSAISAGFRYVRSHRRVAELIGVSAAFWAVASVVRSVIPALVKDVFGGTYTTIGYYQGILGGGILLGSVVLTLIGPALKSEHAMSWSLKLAGGAGLLMTAVLLFHLPQWVCAVFLGLVGFFGAGIQVSVNALLQRIVPNYLRGRVFGVNDLCSMAGLLAATGALGIPNWPQIDRHITWITALTSGGLLAVGIWTSFVRLGRGRFTRKLAFWLNLSHFNCRLVARLKRVGICTIPIKGPVIVAANHNSVWDPFVLSAGCPNRYISYMIAKEYAAIPLFRGLTEAIECIPVSRSGNDTQSIKAALRHLADGKVLGIFPTGRIVMPDEAPEVREGVGMLALRSGATVIPAYIWGMEPPDLSKKTSRVADLWSMVKPCFRRQNARVRYGRPFDLSPWKGREKDREAFKEVSEAIMRRILALRDDLPAGN